MVVQAEVTRSIIEIEVRIPTAVDAGDEEVLIAVVVSIKKSGVGVGFAVIQSALSALIGEAAAAIVDQHSALSLNQ